MMSLGRIVVRGGEIFVVTSVAPTSVYGRIPKDFPYTWATAELRRRGDHLELFANGEPSGVVWTIDDIRAAVE